MLWPYPQILRPNWKGFPRAKPLAYWASSSVTKEKSFRRGRQIIHLSVEKFVRKNRLRSDPGKVEEPEVGQELGGRPEAGR